MIVKDEQTMFDNFLHQINVNSMIFSQLYMVSFEIKKYYSDSMHVCNIRIGHLDGLRGQVQSGWLYPKNSILKRHFDKFLIQLGQTGIERQIRDKYFAFMDPFTKCNTAFNPVGLHIVAILFKILGFGLGLATLSFIFEYLIHKCTKLSRK